MQNKVVDSAECAISDIRSGASIFVGGFGGAGIPKRMLAALNHSSDAKDLTLINNNAGSGDENFLALISSGRVRRIICSYPRMPGSHIILEQIKKGTLTVDVMPQGTLIERIRAAGSGLGPFFTPTGYGTLFAEGKEVRVINGRGYVLEEPLPADYALICAHQSDPLGNLVYRYAQRNFGPAMCMAASVTIAEVDEVVCVGNLDPCHVVTPGVFVDRIVEGAK